MPNWCSNTVTFKHDNPDKIKDIVSAWNSGELMNTFFPCPEKLNAADRTYSSNPHEQKAIARTRELNLQEYGYEDWYDWRVSEWGTKWDVGRNENSRSLSAKRGAKSIKLRFESAWAPPVGFYKKMHDEHGYDIHAYFFEPGVGFCGTWRNGTVAEFSFDGVTTPDDVRETIPAPLIHEFGLLQFYNEETEHG